MSFTQYETLYPKYFKKLNQMNDNFDSFEYVYGSVGKYLIVYKKMWLTVTNEKRKNIYDHLFAEYKANKLLVVLIIDKKNPQINLTNLDQPIKHTINKQVKCPKNEIIFYKSYVVAYYTNLLDFYKTELSEPYISWYENGRKSSEGNLLNSELNGKWIFWYNISNHLMPNKKSFVAEYDKGIILNKIEL